jgi:hypothetical protein
MFEKLNRIAEQAATRASRRQFLGRLGKGALAAAAAVSGLLVLPADSPAAPSVRARCCFYRCGNRGGTSGQYVCHADGSACRRSFRCGPTGGVFGCTCTLVSERQVSGCSRCGR